MIMFYNLIYYQKLRKQNNIYNPYLLTLKYMLADEKQNWFYFLKCMGLYQIYTSKGKLALYHLVQAKCKENVSVCL